MRSLPDGTKTKKKAEACSYNSKPIAVTEPKVLNALNSIYAVKNNMTHFPGVRDSYGRIKYAQHYGRLNKHGEIGTLKTIILSNEGKVFQLNDNGRHMELKWQNDKAITKPSFGTINWRKW